MAMTKEQIIREAMALDPAEWDDIADALRQSLRPNELTRKQIEELDRRIDDAESGRAKWIPGEEVVPEVRERFER